LSFYRAKSSVTTPIFLLPPDDQAPTPAAAAKPACTIIKQKHSRWWEVRDPENELVCLTVYRKGARDVVRRLAL
jgi:hypothetical protein